MRPAPSYILPINVRDFLYRVPPQRWSEAPGRRKAAENFYRVKYLCINYIFYLCRGCKRRPFSKYLIILSVEVTFMRAAD